MSDSDEALVERMGEGDRLAMQAFFGRHHLRVYRFALRIVRQEAEAEDLVGEVFLDVWRQAARFEGRSSPTTWLLGITRNKAYSSFRQRREDSVGEDEAAEIADAADSPETVMQKKNKGEVLRRCLNKLSVEHREILDLVYYHEQSVEDVSAILGIPENTVKTRMFYARKRLSELLKAAGVDRGWP